MAEVAQKTYMLFVRPFYVDENGNKLFHRGEIYTPPKISKKISAYGEGSLAAAPTAETAFSEITLDSSLQGSLTVSTFAQVGTPVTNVSKSATIIVKSASQKLGTGIVGGDTISDTFINEEKNYSADPWLLHSTYVSYEKLRRAIKTLLADNIGTNNIRVGVFVPIDYEILPNK